MTENYFEHMHNRGREEIVSDIVEFEKDETLKIEHVDKSTIVEKIKMTPELKKVFKLSGNISKCCDNTRSNFNNGFS